MGRRRRTLLSGRNQSMTVSLDNRAREALICFDSRVSNEIRKLLGGLRPVVVCCVFFFCSFLFLCRTIEVESLFRHSFWESERVEGEGCRMRNCISVQKFATATSRADARNSQRDLRGGRRGVKSARSLLFGGVSSIVQNYYFSTPRTLGLLDSKRHEFLDFWTLGLFDS